MKVKKSVNVDVDVEMHVSVEDISQALLEAIPSEPELCRTDPNRWRVVMEPINAVFAVLKAMPDAVIQSVPFKAREMIYLQLLAEVERWKTVQVTED